jgi:predicted ATPase/class 3 adenylate cyclase
VVAIPSGTVTFLFTDLEGSTRLWEDHPKSMQVALSRHDEIVRSAIDSHRGHVVKTTGDGFHAAFATAQDAVGAAVDAQGVLGREVWGETGPLLVRMGIHTGEAQERDGDYFGGALNRAARLMSVAYGGQIVCSQATADLVRDSLAGGVTIIDLGEHRLRDLARPERVFQVGSPGLEREFPPLRTGDAVPGNLPRQMTTFVGRETEVELVARLVSSQPLVTLTGVGGVGKTRLALEVAETVRREFPDGGWLCELAPIGDGDAIWDALAATLRVVPPPGRRLEEFIVEHLAAKRALLVVDNCEHLLKTAARIVGGLARACPGLVILATSREGLAVPGEQIVAVSSLAIPEPGATAVAISEAASVQLFCDRARSVKHDFAPAGPTLDAVAQLCRRLDGIPLAIELAAARIGSLSPEDLVARLDQRFRLLTRGSRASLERHETLRNTIDWSYDLLDDGERLALQRLSVFAGGADLDALEAVLSTGEGLDCDDIVDAVSRLVDKSLVVADPDDEGHLRYRMLEMIRQYAQERLEASGDVAAVRSAHAEYYVAFAEVMGPRLRSRELPIWARRVDRETDNLRIVIDWAVDTKRPDLALCIVEPLRGHGHATGNSATEWADTAIDIPGAEGLPEYLAVASWATFGAAMRSDLDRATEIAARIERVQTERGRSDPSAYWGLGTLAFFQGDLDGAHRLAEQWVATARAADDGYQLSHALVLYASTSQFLGDPAARPQMEEAAHVARDTGALSALSMALSMLCNMLDPDQDGDQALALVDEAGDVASQIGDAIAWTVAMGTRANMLAARGQHHEALTIALRTAEAIRSSNNYPPAVPILSAAWVALAELGDYRNATILCGATFRLGPRSPAPWIGRRVQNAEATLHNALGSDFQALYDEGLSFTASDAIAFVADLRIPATR